MEDKKAQGTARVKTPTARSKTAWWKIILQTIGLLIWVGASIYISQLFVAYLLIWLVDDSSLQEPMWQAIFSASSYTLALILTIPLPFYLSRRLKAKQKNPTPSMPLREQLGLQKWTTWADIGLALIGFLVYILLAAGITALFQLFPWFEVNEVQDVGFNYLASGLDRIIAFVTLVVIAPIAEEIIFRGWLYGKLRRKFSDSMSNYGGMAIAILLTSLLFGLIHGQWNVGVNVFAMSIVLCGLREITGTIHAGIILHMLKNGLAFYLLYVVGF